LTLKPHARVIFALSAEINSLYNVSLLALFVEYFSAVFRSCFYVTVEELLRRNGLWLDAQTKTGKGCSWK